MRTKVPRRISVEKEAEKAIGAFANPAVKSGSGDAPAYTPDEKRELNRLIEQQNAQ